ncbi:MAG: CDGSH iron-sulfur domain-containing protein [Mariprofundaceae bacterium]|nr:CDGSH iron-sulfur domain-containing protein [Mariprofundaceae bacterium]
MAMEKHETDEGTLCFDGRKCIHSRNCVLSRPDVFVPNVEGEWIHPERATTDELHTLADNCPSGAIQFIEHGKGVRKPLVNTLHIRENGPYALKAEIQIDGEVELQTRLTLCRCGATRNPPYCDGSHTAAGFTATGEPAVQGSEPLEQRDGPVKLSPIKDGPLMLEGNLEMCAGTGKTINRTREVFLCRCGASKNKPYCDGSHQKIGFKSGEQGSLK